MKQQSNGAKFAELFRKYRLKSEIDSLSHFGDLLSEEGLTYETSLFTRWQRGNRIPGDRKTLIGIVKVFSKRGGITIDAANKLLESAGQGYLTANEIKSLPQQLTEYTFAAPFSSIAELVKSHRLRRDLTIEEIALSAGWGGTDIIQRIESGEVEKPPREVIDVICNVLKLEEQEKNALLLAGNYMPTKEEILAIQQKVLPEIEKWPYSAVVYDFCWRVIRINDRHAQILGLKKEDLNIIHSTSPVALNIVFDPNFTQNRNLKGEDLALWHKNLLRFIIHFRSLQKSVIKESWYQDAMKSLMKNKLFREVWRKAADPAVKMLVTRHAQKIFVEPKQKIKLKYNIFVVPLLHDPRFEIEYYSPADIHTTNYLLNQEKNTYSSKTATASFAQAAS